ncbi:MAG: hypothetical protein DKT66_28390 [Candidatus Melainabacteria bacterium]|nr:MAG: hypothetical protein DKT66_28390 [Candidatus Melainabacteria bacterium]
MKDIHDVYGWLLQDFAKKPPPLSKSSVQAGGNCFMECRRLLTVGVITLLRGHVGDSAMYARRAIESMCFAVRAWSDDRAANAWLNFLKSKTASKKYRDMFPLMRLLGEWKENFQNGPRVYAQYEWLSNQVHPTYSSMMFAQRREEDEEEKETTFNLSYFDAENGPHLLATMYFEILSTHLAILYCVAEYVLQNDESYAQEIFLPFLDGTKIEYLMQRERWKDAMTTIGGNAPQKVNRASIDQAERIINNLKSVDKADSEKL